MEINRDEKRIDEVLSSPILLAERILVSVNEAATFHAECTEVRSQVDSINCMLHSVLRFAGSMYERPVRRIAADVSKNLKRALTLVRKCRRRNILLRVVTIITQADFRKMRSLLDASIGDMRWLLSIFDYDGGGGGIVLSLPSISSNDPILSWIWSFIAALHLGQLSDRIEAATELTSLAQDNDRNKNIIAEEGGVPPLLKLLYDAYSADAQIAAATALFNLANNQERVRLIADELGIPVMVKVLGDSPMRVRILVANLVARMAEHDPIVKEGFGRENVIRPLVMRLSFETYIGDPKPPLGKQSIQYFVQINNEMKRNSNSNHRRHLNSPLSSYSDISSQGGNHRGERENESPEVKHKLKISCAEALWILASGSVSNSRMITETKGLLCLAKLIEKEPGELQFNCLMAIMEITAAAESDAELRRAAFKTNSSAAKAVVDQLLWVVKELDIPSLQLPAIKSIGSLARTFHSRETRVIGPLVERLSHSNQDVATEAAIALGKFACPENFLCLEHSKTIIEFDSVPPLMRLLMSGERTKLHGLVLLCYLAMHAGDSEALEEAQVLMALEGVDRAVAAQHPVLKELIPKAIYHVRMYRAGVHPHR
ncbi:ARM REPEAT PROTEIN INTERACTING WITH like [Actinidia chinensis var. chinensis]|uniref:ARM REPEAT PROTEIN INTERACTING WITH like n=1 Tax=Actinidia chinensis var. chinensis TaxID=1590841 RepID=A0A2R6RET5_ACTCC|nr:ARM REPEAT PROTEIN INTERACTING WITH like [Actinidia chinensis var. chinensis]